MKFTENVMKMKFIFYFFNSTPLHIAVAQNNLNTVFVLLSEGADPNAQNKDGNTPLHLCARIKNINIAQALIAAGADLEAKNKHKKSPISAAKLCKNVELQDLIKDIQTNRIKKPELHYLINKFLPILNKVSDEEEEEEDEEEKKTEKIEKKVETKIEKKVENKKKNIEKNEESTKTKAKSKNKEKPDSKKESKDIFDIDENDINPDSIETYQLILQQLNQLQQRIDCLSSNPSANYNENDNDNDQIESETFDSICNFINQISDRINKLESDQNFEKIEKGQMKSLDDVLDKIQVLSNEINKIDNSQQSNLDQKTRAIEDGKKEENKVNSETNKHNIENNTENKENVENKEDIKNNEIAEDYKNKETAENTGNVENIETSENKKSVNINDVDVDTIKEEFDFDDSEDVESILVGCGAVCDVCGDPATKMCNVCKHKFCQICIGSTKHIEYHLELDDE